MFFTTLIWFRSVYKISNSFWFCIHFWIKWEMWKTFDAKMIGWTHFTSFLLWRYLYFLTIRLKNILILFYIFSNSFLQSTYLNTVLDCWQSKNKDLLPPTHKGKSLTTKDIAAWKQYFLSDLPNRDYTLTTAEISRGKNARAWVSMVLYLKK